ncbi:MULTISPECIES: hypothetical protein [Saccharothrix]|uniref:hypothetical protein n=1 Tax=Saccharothrix TaxID=2071 RepID=UPI0027D321BC|nr:MULTISPECIES: hypothetical protein [Saccharothrix]MDU0288420.1 hypothetical protein [Saccharothrix longispora]
MRNTEEHTLAELIEDCTALPEELMGRPAEVRESRAATWEVDDAHYAQVAELEAYV